MEAVDAVLRENLLKTHRTIGGDPVIQTPPGLGVIMTHTSEGRQEASHQQPLLTSLQSLDEHQRERAGDQRVSGNAQQSSIIPPLSNVADMKEQQLNQLSQSSDPRATTTGVESTLQQQALTHGLTSSEPLIAQANVQQTNEAQLSAATKRTLNIKEDPEVPATLLIAILI